MIVCIAEGGTSASSLACVTYDSIVPEREAKIHDIVVLVGRAHLCPGYELDVGALRLHLIIASCQVGNIIVIADFKCVSQVYCILHCVEVALVHRVRV